jgi:hypothetical protein
LVVAVEEGEEGEEEGSNHCRDLRLKIGQFGRTICKQAKEERNQQQETRKQMR